MIGLLHIIRQVSGSPWPATAPDPLPERDHWLSQAVIDYVPAPSTLGSHLQDRVKEARSRPGLCAACDVTWTDPAALCWSCHPGETGGPFDADRR